MPYQVNHAWSEKRLDLEHVSDQVLELWCEEALIVILFVFLPEKVNAIVVEILIVVIRLQSGLKRRMARIQGKQDYSKGENVCLGQQGLVYLHLEELWCHVPTVTLGQW